MNNLHWPDDFGLAEDKGKTFAKRWR